MAISQFPPASSGGGLSNDFILNKNNTTNNTFALPREFEAGGYALVTSSNDSSFDIYLLNAAGSAVGYSNGSAIVASEPFAEVVVLGVGTAETVQFSYRGPSTNATAQGQEAGAGAYLISIFPSDLPNIDDTATVAGGNFSTAVQITFESGTVSLPAKNIVVGSSTALVVTRPDNLIQDNSPYSLRAVNPGVTQPTGTNSNVLTGTVTAGADPTFITPALITGALPNAAFSTSILVSDSDGTVVNWAITAGTIPPGLSLATATGAISGTPTTSGDYFFTVRITDDGQNTNSRQFNLPVGPQFTGVTGSTVVGGTTYAWATASNTFVYKNVTSGTVEYIQIAGGGGGGSGAYNSGVFEAGSGAGGGAGGLLLGTATGNTGGTLTMTIGGGGNANTGTGTNTILFGTAFGGGGGAQWYNAGINGGSGGGGNTGGLGTAGQGSNGGNLNGGRADKRSPGGGGANAAGETSNASGNGGAGRQFGAWASAIGIIYNAGFYSGGGGGGCIGTGVPGSGGSGGGGVGAGSATNSGAGSANSGGGGGGGGQNGDRAAAAGGSGLVIVRTW